MHYKVNFLKNIIKRKAGRIIFLYFLLALTVTCTGCFLNDDSSGTFEVKKYGPAAIAAIENIAQNSMDKYSSTATLIAVWSEGYETLLISKGISDSASGRPVKITDSFRIASNTKMFVAMSILMLADRQKLLLDDKLSKYIPEIPHSERVSIRQLADHTSGYFNYTSNPSFAAAVMSNPLKKWTPEEIMGLVKDKPLDFVPGEKHSYSNTNYIILGMLVEKLSGVNWETFVTQNILKPLNMNDTYCPDGPSITGEHLHGYYTEGTRTVELAVDPSIAWASGSMVSTIFDMKKWLDALSAGTLISPSMLAEQRKYVPMSLDGTSGFYGFGIMKENMYIGHTGSIPGYNSFVFISIDGKNAIIAVHNNSDGIDELGGSVMKYLNMF